MDESSVENCEPDESGDLYQAIRKNALSIGIIGFTKAETA